MTITEYFSQKGRLNMERYILVDALSQYPTELKNYPEAQDDTELVRLAVRKNGYALAYASQRLCDDYETVMIAVRKTGRSLKYASAALRRNREIIDAAIHSDGCALGYVPEDLQQDRQLVLEAAKNTCSWSLIPETFQTDKEIVLEVIAHYENVYPYIPAELADDMDIILAALDRHSDLIATVVLSLPDEVLADKEKMLQIVTYNSAALEYASEELQKDKEVAMAALDSAIRDYDKCRWVDENGFWSWIPSFSQELWEDPDIKCKLVPYLYGDCGISIPWEIQCHIDAGNINYADIENQVMVMLESYGISCEAVCVEDDETARLIMVDRREIDEDGYCMALDDNFWDSWIDQLNEDFGAPYEENEED